MNNAVCIAAASVYARINQNKFGRLVFPFLVVFALMLLHQLGRSSQALYAGQGGGEPRASPGNTLCEVGMHP